MAITLQAVDWMSGVEKIMVSLDGNPYETYVDGINLKDEKEYTLRYYAVDHTGNMEAVHKVIIVIDKSAPRANFKLAGNTNNNVLSGSSTIGFSSDEDAAGIAGIYYSIDSGAFKPYEYALNTRYLPQGDHNVRFFAEDHLGNRSDTSFYAFYIDKTPPVIVQSFIGKSFIANDRIRIRKNAR
ncbi:MAG: Ig-like domain-containing protein [Bacteroidales bacterium]